MHNPGPNPNDSTQRFKLISHYYLLLFQGLNVTLGRGLAAVAVSPHSSDQRAVTEHNAAFLAASPVMKQHPGDCTAVAARPLERFNVFSVVSVKCCIRFVRNAIYPGIDPIRSF